MPYLYEMLVTVVSDLFLILLGEGVYYLWRLSHWARPKRLIKLSKTLEMEFVVESVRLPRKLNNAFPLTTTGTDRKISNVISGHYRDVEMHIFDYEFMAEDRQFSQTVFAFELRRSGVCRFASCPREKTTENPLQYWKGVKHIPAGKSERFQKLFASKHKLLGLNEFGTCLQFNPKAVGFYVRNTDIWTEGGSNWLLVYDLDKVVPIRKMQQRIWKAYQVCRVLQLNNNRVNIEDMDEEGSKETPKEDGPNLSLAS